MSLRFREKIQAVPRCSELTETKIHVAAGILIDSVGRLLITDRSRAKSMRGFWEFPGGKLASGESAEDALRRELAEELEIEIVSFEYFCSHGHDYPWLRVAIDFFMVRQWQGNPYGLKVQALLWLRRAPWNECRGVAGLQCAVCLGAPGVNVELHCSAFLAARDFGKAHA